MIKNTVHCMINAKYIHASTAAWCLAAGVKLNAPHLYESFHIIEGTINQKRTDILDNIISVHPYVVSFSCYIWNIDLVLYLCKELKRLYKNLIIALGGPEVSYCAEKVLNENPAVDYILCGEGEESYPAFLSAVSAGKDPIECDIEGLCARQGDNAVIIRDPCVLEGDAPSPLLAGYAEAAGGRITYIETSRGCPYSCAFCLSGRCGAPRYFNLDRVFDDILALSNSGTQTVKFIDRTFNANPSHANKILAFILDNYGAAIPDGICFHFEVAGDILREDTMELLSKMPRGAVQLEIGMQSFSRKTLEAINRKTNIEKLKQNILRLVKMDNMHIHIDLIAGLPYEDMTSFKNSFNIGYALNCNMLQLGFLKLLYGSAMREDNVKYPCEFNKSAPYEVTSTPYITRRELEVLHYIEDSLERIYNSGRFLHLAKYVIKALGLTPFDFYMLVGAEAEKRNLPSNITLDAYTEFLYDFLAKQNNVNRDLLRDALVRDRLSTNAHGTLPLCLHVNDQMLSKAVKGLLQNKETAPKKGVRRGAAILYSAGRLCYVDYENKNPVTGSFVLHEIPLL